MEDEKLFLVTVQTVLTQMDLIQTALTQIDLIIVSLVRIRDNAIF